MTSETADTDAPPVAASAPADEVVGSSENSSQNTEESAHGSEPNEAKETTQQQEETAASTEAAASEQQGDVEMTEAEADSKQEDSAPAEKQEGDNVEMADEKDAPPAEEEKTQSSNVEMKVLESESKTEEDEPAANGEAEAAAAADAKAAEVEDVEMKESTAEDSKSEGNDAAADNESKNAGKETDESSEAVEAKKDADASASSANQVSTMAKATANDNPDVNGNDPKDVEAKQADTQVEEKSSSSKRKEPVTDAAAKPTSTVNGVAAPTEPASKKQKVDAVGTKDAESAALEGSAPSVMISRDDMAKMEEDSGRLKFDVITNDGTDEHMIQLTTLKNIFAKQLPKMPKEYIVRLVFDKNHRSMLILKNGTHVIGGICYRPFEKNHFAEIAFCAINASDQVKGYGTRLMNHLKEYVKTKNITHFLTYADNYAIGYFKKQGFTKSVSMARPNWYGYIKDYDGGTLMECTIHTQINYLRITSMIHMQREAIQKKIKERSRSQNVYAGLTKFAEGRLMDIYMVPGVKEAGWSQATIRNNRIGTRDQGSLKSQLSQLLKAVSNHRSAWPFHEPVDTSVVVDYLDHIKEPIDLQLISKRIDSGAYISKAAFKTDLEKMCDNCTVYNTPDTNYYKAAVDLREFIQSRIQVRDLK
ncbi:Histone acetyltransferase [Phytophthora fragariae]|uniref:histone acetyltransferase n=1 Tax=Phytophthora fragariae TaxID=53985 RepID=A0A6A4E3C1_9STRA|nr:Histone acetyltransferase [Phytophthora fragariae]KAE9123916.1 Histone acetyltransferase [Phytophthora fragariae]KAE9147844.1 Histone acetyltransferase [Phytophthora fragariae]KAE9228819.1 Histone acetyltransferase [Phytophthora fragariae]KAE9245038.1 Histone acetyltransferase [Phytophthora fragariae]